MHRYMCIVYMYIYIYIYMYIISIHMIYVYRSENTLVEDGFELNMGI